MDRGIGAIMVQMKGKYTSATIMIDSVEESCISQINGFINHSAFTNPVVIMPDTHAGKGSVIGFTMELAEKVIPNVIGVDIGCGMCSVNVGRELQLSLEELDYKIRRRIPFGKKVHDSGILNFKDDFPWHETNVRAEKFACAYRDKFDMILEPPRYTQDWFLEKASIIGGKTRRYINSIGTLGGGNHFIETGIAENGDHWITVHSGSRNLGKRICEYWQNLAVKCLKKSHKENIQLEIDKIRQTCKTSDLQREIKKAKERRGLSSIKISGCEWLENEMAAGYLFDMIFAQMYAQVNRRYMVDIICSILKVEPIDSIETIHNFIDFKDFIIRKGAIRSYKNEKMIIPFNMRDGLLICEGKSNPAWNFSAPHGAGRIMSRSQAKKQLDVDIFKEQMKGIYSTSVGMGTLDESPDSYKDAVMIEDAIKDTALIVTRVKPLHNMKDGGAFVKRRKGR